MSFYPLEDKIRRNILISCDHGLMIVNRFDVNAGNAGQGVWLLDHGNVSTVEAYHSIKAIKREDPIIFDVGANIGTYTTWMAKHFPKGKIYAFEPQRLVFQILCGNMALNNFYNTHIYNFGLGSENNTIEFYEPNYYMGEDFGIFSLVEDKIIHKSQEKAVVDIYTLDYFVEHYKVPHIDFIKIDAEGMDLDVLKGAEQSLKKFKPSILVEHSDNRRSIIKQLQDFLTEELYSFEVLGNNLLAIRK